MTYKAIVTKINTRKLEGADKLLIGQCGNYQVVVRGVRQSRGW